MGSDGEKMLPQNRHLGRAATGKGTPIEVRVSPQELSHLDAWIAAQPEPRPSRPEAIRRILAKVVVGADAGSIPIEDLNASNDE
jgi:hypothetical protein